MGILAWIIFGAIAGWIASLIMGEDNRLGPIGNIVVGILGAVLGAWIARFLGVGEDGVDFDLGSMLAAIVGACILLWVVREMDRR